MTIAVAGIRPEKRRLNENPGWLLCAVTVFLCCASANSAYADTVSSETLLTMKVSGPACTLTNQTPTHALPAGVVGQTFGAWALANTSAETAPYSSDRLYKGALTFQVSCSRPNTTVALRLRPSFGYGGPNARWPDSAAMKSPSNQLYGAVTPVLTAVSGQTLLEPVRFADGSGRLLDRTYTLGNAGVPTVFTWKPAFSTNDNTPLEAGNHSTRFTITYRY